MRSANQRGITFFMTPMPMRMRTVACEALGGPRQSHIGGLQGTDGPANTLPSGWKVRALRITPLTNPKKPATHLAKQRHAARGAAATNVRLPRRQRPEKSAKLEYRTDNRQKTR